MTAGPDDPDGFELIEHGAGNLTVMAIDDGQFTRQHLTPVKPVARGMLNRLASSALRSGLIGPGRMNR